MFKFRVTIIENGRQINVELCKQANDAYEAYLDLYASLSGFVQNAFTIEPAS